MNLFAYVYLCCIVSVKVTYSMCTTIKSKARPPFEFSVIQEITEQIFQVFWLWFLNSGLVYS